MDVIFYAAPAFIACVALAIGYAALRRTLQLRAAWRGGLTAEARCLRAYTKSRGGDHPRTVHHHVYEFTTRGGRTVRFDEVGGSAMTVAGDVVVVHYTDHRPEHATAREPRPVANLTGTVFLLGFLGLVVGFCVYFVADLPTDGF
ncbi:DUF3592 domain-containing protein [Streptomyces longispororuber]|uniref:DUF3592 domain-containing protein n=1 Tax=Streptomyces longispororuber TaxID=68230 RepID=UPI0021087C5C|nr:DUF3592 domain-containing protein [Streptomyces longispororuber]MCQ4211991.1 DUF3592 domain-containing protein [Streptomyces longispororuber]